MEKMEITGSTTLVRVLEEHPEALPLFKQIGMCCVSEQSLNDTVSVLCRRYSADEESFLTVLNQLVGG